MRGELARYRGSEIDTAGDGFFASFDGPVAGAGLSFIDRGETQLTEIPGQWRLFAVADA